MQQLSIALLFGSRSSEHDVSITSAYAAYKELEKMWTYTVFPIYISRSWKWYLQKNLDRLDIFEAFVEPTWDSLQVEFCSSDNKLHLIEQKKWLFTTKNKISIDVVFPVLHGKAGEDGSIQWLCEALSIPYVWPRIMSSAITLDKTVTNYLLESLHIPCIPTQVIRSLEDIETKNDISYPVFVKPYNWWSTIGISKCWSFTELKQWAEVAFYFANEVLIQPSIEWARELNCSVMCIGDQVTTTLIQEVHSNAEFLTFDEKYIYEAGWGSMSGLDDKVTIPAKLPTKIEHDIIAITKKIYQEFKLGGAARIDFLYQEKEEKLYVIEINTIPGALQMYLRERSWISKPTFLQNLLHEAIAYNEQRIGHIDFKSWILKNTSSFMKK